MMTSVSSQNTLSAWGNPAVDARDQGAPASGTNTPESTATGPAESQGTGGASGKPGTGTSSVDLTPQEIREVEKLQKRDKEVKAHEMAHLMAAGAFARGGAHYEYEVGPDGKRYAVGGEVNIDVSEIPGNPKATIQKMRTVVRAAMAPASPSAQDRSVAARAEQVESQMQLQLIQSNMHQAHSAYRSQSGVAPGEASPPDQHMVNVLG